MIPVHSFSDLRRVPGQCRPPNGYLVAILFCILAAESLAQTPAVSVPSSVASHSSPVIANSAELIGSMKLVQSTTQLGLSPSFEVKQDHPFEGSILASSVIIFYPGSRLIITGDDGDRRERYIIARTLRILSSETSSNGENSSSATPQIVWLADTSNKGNTYGSVLSQKAAPGIIGSVEGSDGHAGNDGQTGSPGIPGRSAPTVYIVANEVIGGPLVVRLRGEDGGVGETGQSGGDGGVGRTGRSAIPGIIDCRAGGGDGGNGGGGGNGGKGGPGGRGGIGGTFVFVSNKANLEHVADLFQVDRSGGKGGPGGQGGKPGKGADPGSGGNGAGLCGGGKAGHTGADGQPGPSGDQGPDGIPGQFLVTPLTDQQVKSLGLR